MVAGVEYDQELQEAAMTGQRERLLAEYFKAVRAANYAITEAGEDRAAVAVDAAWDAVADWKHDHDECMQSTCTRTVTDYSYCEAHR